MTWHHKEPGHQQSWYWPHPLTTFHSPHRNNYQHTYPPWCRQTMTQQTWRYGYVGRSNHQNLDWNHSSDLPWPHFQSQRHGGKIAQWSPGTCRWSCEWFAARSTRSLQSMFSRWRLEPRFGFSPLHHQIAPPCHEDAPNPQKKYPPSPKKVGQIFMNKINSLNPGCVKFISGKIKMYLQFL